MKKTSSKGTQDRSGGLDKGNLNPTQSSARASPPPSGRWRAISGRFTRLGTPLGINKLEARKKYLHEANARWKSLHTFWTRLTNRMIAMSVLSIIAAFIAPAPLRPYTLVPWLGLVTFSVILLVWENLLYYRHSRQIWSEMCKGADDLNSE